MDVNKENKKFKDKKETSIMKKKVLAAILMGTMVFSMADVVEMIQKKKIAIKKTMEQRKKPMQGKV